MTFCRSAKMSRTERDILDRWSLPDCPGARLMISEHKPPSVFQLAWVLVVVLAFAGLMFHLDWNASDHPSQIPAPDLVGAWVVDLGGKGSCTEMRPDGTYTEVGFGVGSDGQVARGYWSVEGDLIAWDTAPGRTSGYTTRIYNASGARFTAVLLSTEMGDHRRVYERLPGLGAHCTATALAKFTS